MNKGKERQVYFCSSEKNGKIVDMAFKYSKYSAFKYKRDQEKLGRTVSFFIIVEYCKDQADVDDRGHKGVKLSRLKGWSKRIMCVETGEVYNTIRECQKANGIGNWVIRKAVYENKVVNGKHYKIIN